MNWLSPVVVAVLSALVTSIVSHWFVLKRLRAETTLRTRSEFFAKQLAAYTKFWSLLGPTSRHTSHHCVLQFDGSTRTLNAANTRALCQSLTDFFFSEHGIFLSSALRAAVFDTRTLLTEVLAENPSLEAVPLSNRKCEKIQHSFQKIYITSRKDLGLQDLKVAQELTES